MAARHPQKWISRRSSCRNQPGLEAETGRLLQDVAREALGDSIPLAVISGPTFAKELAAGMPTAISLASTDDTFADDLQQLLHCGASVYQGKTAVRFL